MSIPELELGVERLKESGFEVTIDPQCRKKHLYFAGEDEVRARALFEAAHDPQSELVWCARGGYGAGRLLPILERLTQERGVPPCKVLAGYSDTTALYAFVRARWGWSVLHSPMPGFRGFCVIPEPNWRALVDAVSGAFSAASYPWNRKKLKFFKGTAPEAAIEADLVGGNLSVYNSVSSTPFAEEPRGKMVFFEDVDEPLYKMDRYVTQLELSGALRGAQGIILGHHEGVFDRVGQGLKKLPSARTRDRVIRSPKPSELEPLRKPVEVARGLEFIFGGLGRRLGIPVAYGLPVGHGPAGQCPLPLHARYRLSPQGQFELLHWDGWTEARE